MAPRISRGQIAQRSDGLNTDLLIRLGAYYLKGFREDSALQRRRTNYSAAMPSSPQTKRLSCLHPERLPPAALRITVIDSPDSNDKGRIFDLPVPIVSIGRAESNDVRINDSMVSHYHVELRGHAEVIHVCDCGSTNGIRADEIWMQTGYLPSGRTLSIGKSKLLIESTDELSVPSSEVSRFGSLLGESAPMRRLFAELQRVSSTDINLLILGETGTGKELVARAVHEKSQRRHGPYRILDCAALMPSLAHSKIFGHVKGAFTGAVSDVKSIFEEADGGVVFIDELGDLTLDQQKMLLRVLDTKTVTRLGSNKEIPVDVRILCATWKDLRKLVNEDKFRLDLYQRVAMPTLRIPPLCERREDIPGLVQHFMRLYCAKYRLERRLDPLVAESLVMRDYPGNVRELERLVESLVALSASAVVTIDDLARLRAATGEFATNRVPQWPQNAALQTAESLLAAKERFYREYLRELLVGSGNVIARAAKVAKVSRPRLRQLLYKYGLRKQPPARNKDLPSSY